MDMSNPLPNYVATLGYWVRLGLSISEAFDRAVEQYGPGSEFLMFEAVTLFQQTYQAGQAVQLSGATTSPVSGVIPCIPGQAPGYKYGVMVPVYDPNSQTTTDWYTVVTSASPLSGLEVQQAGLEMAGKTLELSPEKFIGPGKAPFEPVYSRPGDVAIMTASCGFEL